MPPKKPIKLNDAEIQRWMKKILSRADQMGKLGEIPVAAVILDDKGMCIGYGTNTKNKFKDPLGHAELNALRQASSSKGDWRFNECTLIVNLEPCVMCSAAIIQARMGQVIFGAIDKKKGGLGGSIDLSIHNSAHHKMIVQGGVMGQEAKLHLEKWFKELRIKI